MDRHKYKYSQPIGDRCEEARTRDALRDGRGGEEGNGGEGVAHGRRVEKEGTAGGATVRRSEGAKKESD